MMMSGTDCRSSVVLKRTKRVKADAVILICGKTLSLTEEVRSTGPGS